MSKIVFRNYDKKQLKSLLKEIGKERYEAALQDAGFTSKPLSLEGFYVEYDVNERTTYLYFKFPIPAAMFVMDVLGFWAVPKEGWEMLRVEED